MSGSLATNLDADGNGLTAFDYRKILQAFYPNPGIVKGGKVTGNSSLTYHVAPTVAVIDRGSDGTRLVYYAGGNTPAVAAGDASNRRIDVIWLKANDPALDGGSNEVTIGVTQGTPSANPVVPTLDSGKLALMEKLVQPGTTNLSTGSGNNRSYNYAIPYGASIGKLGEYWDKRTFTGAHDHQKPYYEFPIHFYIPTDRIIEFVFDVCYGSTGSDYSEWACGFQVDGVTLDGSTCNFKSDKTWESHRNTFRAVVKAGYHTARCVSWNQNGSAPRFHYGPNASGLGAFVGRRFQIWDCGAAK